MAFLHLLLPQVSSHKPRNDMVCPLCMMVVTQVKSQLADPVTQEEIREKSMQACAALPAGMMQDTCMGFVEQWGEQGQWMGRACMVGWYGGGGREGWDGRVQTVGPRI